MHHRLELSIEELSFALTIDVAFVIKLQNVMAFTACSRCVILSESYCGTVVHPFMAFPLSLVQKGGERERGC